MVKYSSKKSNKKKVVAIGVLHVRATFNNTIISLTDVQGNVLYWSSAGKQGFKGSRKATPYAAQVTTQSVLVAAQDIGIKSLSVEILGPGVGREASLRALQTANINITYVIDKTYHPHNGCRPPKRRRV